jgi:hypothetical protein
MINGVRDSALALACVRHGAPAWQGRGIDSLPPDSIAAVEAALVRSLDTAELRRAFAAACDALAAEIAHADATLSSRLVEALHELVNSR